MAQRSKKSSSRGSNLSNQSFSGNDAQGKDNLPKGIDSVDVKTKFNEDTGDVDIKVNIDMEHEKLDTSGKFHLKSPLKLCCEDEIYKIIKIPVDPSIKEKDINERTAMTYGIDSVLINALHVTKKDGKKIQQVNGEYDLPVVNDEIAKEPLDIWYVDIEHAKLIWRNLLREEIEYAIEEEKIAKKITRSLLAQFQNERF